MIDPTLRGVCAHFGIDPTLIAAVEKAEGNIVRAVACSVPSVTTREKALDITCRSAVHAMCDFIKAKGLQAEFIAAWGAKWAPVGAENDPKNLNKNWASNTLKSWLA